MNTIIWSIGGKRRKSFYLDFLRRLRQSIREDTLMDFYRKIERIREFRESLTFE